MTWQISNVIPLDCPQLNVEQSRLGSQATTAAEPEEEQSEISEV